MEQVWTALASHGALAVAMGFALKIVWEKLRVVEKECADERGRHEAERAKERQRQDERYDGLVADYRKTLNALTSRIEPHKEPRQHD